MMAQKASAGVVEYEMEGKEEMEEDTDKCEEYGVDCAEVGCDDAEQLHEWSYKAMME